MGEQRYRATRLQQQNKWSASRSGRFTHGQITPGANILGGWVRLNSVWTPWKRQNSHSCRVSSHDLPVFQVLCWPSYPGTLLTSLSRYCAQQAIQVLCWPRYPGTLLTKLTRHCADQAIQVLRWPSYPGNVLTELSKYCADQAIQVLRWPSYPNTVLTKISSLCADRAIQLISWPNYPGTVLTELSR
jgi:hypothetical protein